MGSGARSSTAFHGRKIGNERHCYPYQDSEWIKHALLLSGIREVVHMTPARTWFEIRDDTAMVLGSSLVLSKDREIMQDRKSRDRNIWLLHNS